MAARTGSLRPLSPGAALSGVHILAPGLPLDQAKAEAPARYHCGDPLVAQPMEALNEVAAEGAQRRLLGHLTQPDGAVYAQAVIASVDSDIMVTLQAYPTVAVIA